MSLEFRILGPIEVREHGRVCAFGGPKQRALLAALLLRRGEVVATERLIEDVWAGERAGAAGPERPGLRLGAARGARRSRADSERGRRLSPRGGARRARRRSFERLLGEGRRLLASGDAPTALRRLDEALALWRVPPLPDVAYKTFAQGEISRLEELRVMALEERIEAELELGRHGDLVGELQTLVAEEPLRERLRRQLMLALYRSGRQADALAVYQGARRTLLDELGLEPSPELRELEAAILRQDPSLSVEPPELRARRNLPAPATALVGRATEVADVVTLLRQESPRLLTLTGAGGTGKTRLALQAASDVVDRFADGVFFVGLGPLSDPQLVQSTIAHTLGEANTLRNLGSLAKDAGDYASAQALHEEARTISAESGDRLGVHSSLVNLSDAALSEHEYGRAETLAQEAVLLARELGHEARELASLLNLGLASLHRGNDEQARASVREAVRLSLALRWPECLVVGLEGLAGLDAEHGDPLRAARLMGAAECLLEPRATRSSRASRSSTSGRSPQ